MAALTSSQSVLPVGSAPSIDSAMLTFLAFTDVHRGQRHNPQFFSYSNMRLKHFLFDASSVCSGKCPVRVLVTQIPEISAQCSECNQICVDL